MVVGGARLKRSIVIQEYVLTKGVIFADFDRLIAGQKAGLECKTVSPYSADKWSDDDIPVHYQMQCQHYMAVSGYDCWYIAALIFGRDFII